MFESIHRRKDGTTFPVEAHGCLLEARGRRYLLGLVRDVSERKDQEERMRQAQKSAEEASEADRDAPRVTPVRRVDEARAARQLIPTFDARPAAG